MGSKGGRHLFIRPVLRKRHPCEWTVEGISEKLSHTNIFENMTSRNKNVPEISWYIQTIKESVRGVLNVVPLKISADILEEMQVCFG